MRPEPPPDAGVIIAILFTLCVLALGVMVLFNGVEWLFDGSIFRVD